MKRSQSRILTTHVGSLVRPKEIVEILQGKADGSPFSEAEGALVARHVAEAVRMQAECGIDIPSDGEYSKTGFSQYITDRLTGFELRTDLPGRGGGTARSRDRRRFPDAYREIEGSSQNAPTSTGQPQLQMIHTVCTGPISYRGQAAIQSDIANFKAALAPLGF
jgi:5-methyltetrahydropteroyltriglutamate--homocysteine methyltransferase